MELISHFRDLVLFFLFLDDVSYAKHTCSADCYAGDGNGGNDTGIYGYGLIGDITGILGSTGLGGGGVLGDSEEYLVTHTAVTVLVGSLNGNLIVDSCGETCERIGVNYGMIRKCLSDNIAVEGEVLCAVDTALDDLQVDVVANLGELSLGVVRKRHGAVCTTV